ncbi:efflux RND transporter periplasmic adaptor subunit [Streptomyces sp. NBC_01006]|uniref:efflux RND transporter periplasmic adaptor subunit n=1 Tax=Streptomyces sp. NBC_01006 TaxID=2903716 RepID=UPI00386E1D31|nr:HlyD family efflux transporter periplasmic adaptor subunit [Streptomyces sp. NBC_01006]
MKVLPRRRRAVLINSVLSVAVLAGAGGAYAAVTSGSDGPARGGARTVAVTKGAVLATVSGSGSLSSPSDVGVNFTTGGRLTEVDVKPGDKVTKGQLLGKVDSTAATETLTQARAALTAAQANVTKAEAGQVSSASGSGASSSRGGSAPAPTPTPTVDPAQVAQARAQLTQAQNAVDAAQRAVDGTVLKAPAAGTVASVSAKVGDTVSGTNGSGGTGGGNGGNGGSGANSASSAAASPASLSGIVVLTNPSGMQVTANFSEADALKLKPGQPATVTLNAMAGKVLNAQVLSVSSLPTGSGSSSGGGNSGGGSAVQYAATLTITSPTDDLRSGLSASIQVVVGEASGALSVPTAAVSGTGANRSVTVVKGDGTAVRTPVTVGLEGDSTDQILSGLTEGEQVQLAAVSSTGSGGFPGGAFPGGAGAGATRNRGTGAGGFRTGGGGGGRG